jgi:uncharacterized caspase-like protein
MANNWAIVVGVNDYDFLPEASLRFAVKDALAMKAFLCEEAGFPEKQVLLCGDGSSGTRKATRPILRNILRSEIQHAQNADNLWFFFSGHGLGEHLMPIDGNPDDLTDTAISIHFVTERLRACKAKNIVLVLDMCRNEHHEVGRKSVEQKSAVSVADSLKKLVQHRAGQQGIITLFSCGRGESSYEITSLEQGAFTYALLEGLKQQTILKELETYLARRVPELHSVSGKMRKQVPLVIPEPGWKYNEPIFSSHATVADIARLIELAKEAELEEEFGEAKKLLRQIVELSDVKSERMAALKAIDRIEDKIFRQNKLSDLNQVTPAPLPPPRSIWKPKPKPYSHSHPLPKTPVTIVDSRAQIPLDAIPLDSEKGVDYCNLRDLLKAGQWKEADKETFRVMLKAANRVSDGWLDAASLQKFPCKDLKTIDQLWVTASNGHFGFSVQKKIWEDCGSPTSSGKNWDQFCVRVGWQNKQATEYVNYSDLEFNPSLSPKGELPIGVFLLGVLFLWFKFFLFSRAKTCEL